MGQVEGEKALFHLLALREGTFAFVSAGYSGAIRIHRGMEEALLEGMRQADEVALLRKKLPAPSCRIRIASSTSLPSDQHPVTAEVVRLLSEPKTLADLLDLASATDYEVLAALGSLLEKGIAQTAQTAQAAGTGAVGPLLEPAQLHALRARFLRSRMASREVVGKVLLMGAAPQSVSAFLQRMTDFPSYR